MRKRRRFTDEELLDEIRKFASIKELREVDLNLYQIARRRGLSKDIKKYSSKYTDEELIDWINSYTTRTQLYKNSNVRYDECIRRGLDIHFPDRVNKSRVEKKKKPERVILKPKTAPSYLFKTTKNEDGTHTCGRCLQVFIKTNKPTCRKCYNRISSLNSAKKDTNPWNVKDEFCNIEIKHHEKVFNIGIIVDERTQWYLTAVGYGFMFKEPYDEKKYEI